MKAENTETIRIIEFRFAWVIRVMTAILAMGVTSIKAADDDKSVSEYDVCLKIINIQGCMIQSQKVDEKLELSMLNFMAIFRTNVLADPKIVSKLSDGDDTSTSRTDGYMKIADRLSAKDALAITEEFLK